jgi:hypothetical protein
VNNACSAPKTNSCGNKRRTVCQNALLTSWYAFHQIFNASSTGLSGGSTIHPDKLESALAQARENDISAAYSGVCHLLRYPRRSWPRCNNENVTLNQLSNQIVSSER